MGHIELAKTTVRRGVIDRTRVLHARGVPRLRRGFDGPDARATFLHLEMVAICADWFHNGSSHSLSSQETCKDSSRGDFSSCYGRRGLVFTRWR